MTNHAQKHPMMEDKLSSIEMAEFVSEGYLRLDELIPKDLCDRALEEIREGTFRGDIYRFFGKKLSEVWEGSVMSEIVKVPRFAGAIESLVGPDPYFDHYAAHQIGPGEIRHAEMHQDAEYDTRFNAFDIQFSIFFHDVPKEMGGTLFVPGTHFRPVRVRGIQRYHHIKGSVPSVAKAGTVVLWHHNLWHSARTNQTDRLRTMFKTRLNPRVPQVQLWNTSDIQDPQISQILSRGQPWMDHEQRLEIINRIKLWRSLSGDPNFDIVGWMTRAERGKF